MSSTLTPTTALVTVTRELALDTETPVSALLKLRSTGRPAFLLESVEQATQIGRYSFLGLGALQRFVIYPHSLQIHTPYGPRQTLFTPQQGPLEALRVELSRLQPAPLALDIAEAPPFTGGLVGYWAYDFVRFFERLPQQTLDDLSLPWADLLLPEILLAFDHARRRVLAFAYALVPSPENMKSARATAAARLDATLARLQAPLPPQPRPVGARSAPLTANLTRKAFERMVRRAQEHIAAGDIFQVVLSQRLSRPTTADPLSIYRALRRINPSPYMFYLDYGGSPRLALIGASPEMLVRLHDGLAETRPIAGTRPRGDTPQQDQRLEDELRADPKERAEHVMLVDLGRNDLGRVCRYGSVTVPDFMVVERYSHVMHLVSRVTGQLRPGLDALDLLQAAFPAGTVSGAPKVRAMEIIETLEPVRRGPYAGAVGYLGFNGNLDTCITIRTVVWRDGRVFIQAGAGIVADSRPRREWEETRHKAQALVRAISLAEQGGVL